MNKDKLDLWLHDLRTTKEPQCIGHLHSTDPTNLGFCCLGIGCETAIADGADITKRHEDDGPTEYNGLIELPPRAFSKWLDIDGDDETAAQDAGLYREAAAWNDDDELSFAEIADKIEQYFAHEYEGLVT